MMQLDERLEAPCRPSDLLPWVDDLERYTRWLSIVPKAVATDAADGDGGPAWLVDLKGRLGPFARSKRLRMVRAVHDTGEQPHVRFERRELDGREHSPWVLDVELAPTGAGTELRMHLSYGGSLWVPVLDRLLKAEIEGSKPRLLALLN